MNPSALRDLVVWIVVVFATMVLIRFAGIEIPDWVVDRVMTHFGFLIYLLLAFAFVKAIIWLLNLLRCLFVSRADNEIDGEQMLQ